MNSTEPRQRLEEKLVDAFERLELARAQYNQLPVSLNGIALAAAEREVHDIRELLKEIRSASNNAAPEKRDIDLAKPFQDVGQNSQFRQASPRPVDCEDNVTTRLSLWSRFRLDRCSKESEYAKLVPDSHVSFSIPAPHTQRDVIAEIARQAQIPIDSLAEELSHPTFSRGHVVFGYAGDEIDQIVQNYPNMRRWFTNDGLVVAVLSSDQILRKLPPTKLIEQRAARRQAVVMPILGDNGWTRSRLATEAGVAKNSIYDYLDGTRARITDGNRQAIADALDIPFDQLPD